MTRTSAPTTAPAAARGSRVALLLLLIGALLVGVSAGPAQAHAEVRAVCHHVTATPGGHGAAREFCDLLLVARGVYASLLAGHLTTLDGTQAA